MSWEATNWVMDKSANKGAALFCLLLIANDMNSEGWGSFPTVSKLARLMRQPERTVTRILHRLERSGELVCQVRGSGRERTQWAIPGVVRDGYANGARGVKLSPQGSQIAIPGVTKRQPSGDDLSSVPLVYPKNVKHPLDSTTTTSKPGAAAGEITSKDGAKEMPGDLAEWLDSGKYALDGLAAQRLWDACQKVGPWVTPELIKRAVEYKDKSLRGAKNPVGVLISTVPALLQRWGPVGVP